MVTHTHTHTHTHSLEDYKEGEKGGQVERKIGFKVKLTAEVESVIYELRLKTFVSRMDHVVAV